MKKLVFCTVIILALSVLGGTLACGPSSETQSILHSNQGNALARQGNYDEAMVEYNTAIELNPKNATAYSNRGINYSNLKQWELAIADFNKAIELDPKKANAYANRGTAYANKGLIDLAIADYNKAIEVSTDPDITQYAMQGLKKYGVTSPPSGGTNPPSGGSNPPSGGSTTTSNVNYEYWKGDIPNVCYILNMVGERALKLTGKPFMVLTYNRITHEIVDFEFGLSEVTQEGLSTKAKLPVFWEPTLDAGGFNYREKLDLKSPVLIFVGWNISVPGYTSNKSITNGVQNFSTRSNKEEWKFNYTSSLMEGYVKNLDTSTYSGRESESMAFKLMKK